MAQLPWSISVGIWFVESRGGDRFTRQYKPGMEIPARIQAMERMYAEVMSVKDEIKANMRDPSVDATHTQELLLRARGTKYEPLT